MGYFSTPTSTETANHMPLTYIDILYDHTSFLMANDGLLGPPGILSNKSVGIVGGGTAGLVAAYLFGQTRSNT